MMSPLHADARYRIVAEPRMIGMLQLYGWAHRLRKGEREFAACQAGELLTRLVNLGLPFERAENAVRHFDPAEVINFTKWTGLRDQEAVWNDRFVETLRGLILGNCAAGSPVAVPPNPATLVPRRFAVTFEREFNLEGFEPDRMMRLRLPLPLEDAYLRDLKVTPYSPSAAHADFSAAAGRLDAKLPRPRDPNVILGVELDFIAHPVAGNAQGIALPPAESVLYLQESEGLIRISPHIRGLAAQLAGPSCEPWQAIQRFWDFLLDRAASGIIHYDLLDPDRPTDWVLDNGWFDCHLGSAFLVALARAQNIPARLVSGYLLYPVSPGEHYWAEIWLDGAWRPFDTMCSDLSAHGRDRAWRNHFFGCLDYRMKTQCLPRLFNANPAVRLPEAWHIVTQPTESGVEIGFYANKTGAFIYRDRVSVRCLGPA